MAIRSCSAFLALTGALEINLSWIWPEIFQQLTPGLDKTHVGLKLQLLLMRFTHFVYSNMPVLAPTRAFHSGSLQFDILMQLNATHTTCRSVPTSQDVLVVMKGFTGTQNIYVFFNFLKFLRKSNWRKYLAFHMRFA